MLLTSLLGLLSFDSVIPKKEGWIAAVAATTVTPLQTDDGGEFRFGPGLTWMEWSMVLTDAGASIYENATLPESYWKQSNDKYEDYPLHTPPSFAGISDGVIDEVTGIAQLAKLGLEVVTDKQVRDGMAEAVKGLSVEGLKAAAVNMIEERRSIYTGGSPADVTAYTIGKDAVQVASVFYGGFAAKGKQLGEAVEETGGRVRKGSLKSLQARFGKEAIWKLNGFSDNITSLTQKYEISVEEFKRLDEIGWMELTGSQKDLMNGIRNQIPNPDANTIMQKVIPKDDISKYINSNRTPRGFMSTAADAKHLETYEDIYYGLRLDYTDTKFSLSDGSCGVIRFKASNTPSSTVPMYETFHTEDVPLSPFTGHGFTAGTQNRLGVPEVTFKADAILQDGAEMWEVFSNGQEELRAVYSTGKGQFISVDDLMGGADL